MFMTQKKTSFRWFIILLLFWIIVINFIDRIATSFILESLSLEFHFSDIQLGFIMGSFSIGFLITAVIGGVYLDKYGPKIILFLMGMSSVLSMGLMSIATEYWLFLLSRILLGVAQGALLPAITIVIKNWLAVKERARSLSLVFSTTNLGIILSGYIVSSLIYSCSWRGMFISLSMFTIIWLLTWIYFFKNNPEESKFVNLHELEYIKNKANNTSSNTVSYSNKYKKESYPEQKKFFNLKNSIIISNIFAYCCGGFSFYFLISWLPSYFCRTFNINILIQGWIVTFIWSIATIYMFFGGLFLDFIYKKTNSFIYARSYPIIFSNLIAFLCIVMILIFNNMSFYLILGLITLLTSCIMLNTPLYFIINIDVVKNRIGLVLGIMEGSASLAGFISPIITGYILNVTKNFNYVFIFLLSLIFFSTLAVYFFQCRYRVRPIHN